MPTPARLSRVATLAAALVVLVALSAVPAAARPPVAGPVEVFAGDLAGPEGLAFTRDGRLIVGSTTGDLLSFGPDGVGELLATVQGPLAGITVLADGRILATSVPNDRIWAVTPDGESTLFAEGIGGPNFVVQSIRSGRVFVSGSTSGNIVEIIDGEPFVLASGLNFPNGLATWETGGQSWLYVALTLPGHIIRMRLLSDGSLGEPELYAEGLPIADGIAFDRAGNLLVVGGGMLLAVTPSREVVELSEDPLLNWPSNLAFGQGPGFDTRDVYLANFGNAFGNGTDVVRFRYSNPGAPLASTLGSGSLCTPSSFLAHRAPIGRGSIRCTPSIPRRLPRR
ncbi:MAG: hypothetical protein FJ144_09665 [Deltaproteobacteria bacterium]|nr:hypothetical protein [Deltaproteobacteria bacterium]